MVFVKVSAVCEESKEDKVHNYVSSVGLVDGRDKVDLLGT
jgi:hypothetical protein